MTQHARLPLGVAAIDLATRLWSGFSIENMDDDALAHLQCTQIPDGGVASLVLGRAARGVSVRTTSFPTELGDVPLRIYTPSGTGRDRPVVVNFHGGGFALGSARQCDWSCSRVARDLDAVVVSVDYRLAPTHRHPAAVEDCWAALLWTHEHARELGADPDRLGVMGDSAGGNLAAVVAIIARDEGGPRVAHQALIYPATDLTEALLETASYVANTRGLVVSNAGLEIFHGHYLAPGVDSSDWRISPLRAPDLSGLPPAVVVLAGLDPLHDSGAAFAQALADAGGDVRVEDFHRMPHGFVGLPYLCRSAGPAVTAIVASQRAALRPA